MLPLASTKTTDAPTGPHRAPHLPNGGEMNAADLNTSRPS